MEPTEGVPGRRNAAQDDPLISSAAMLEGLPDAVVAIARDERIVFVNALAEALFGYRRDELLGGPVQQLWPERVRARYTDNMRLYFATEHPLRFSTEAWGQRRDGSEFAGEMTWGVVNTAEGPLLLAIGRDITARRAGEQRQRALATISERALAGADPSELAADAAELIRTMLPVRGIEVRLADGAVLVSDGPVGEASLRLRLGPRDEMLIAPERALAEDELGILRTVVNILTTAMDRLRDEDRMRHDALHDPLTGLANRTLLYDRLHHALAQSEREHGDTGVLFVDLDNFKQVNDVYGHRVGDELLAALGGRLQMAVRPADTVARMGGDEFVVVCEHADETGALALADRLEAAIAVPVAAGGVEHSLSASIGIALGHDDADTLLRDADAAVYRAKAAGGARIEIFSPSA
jgi:diguanylate cyclase (GGDEF)-like protein/PAS domain S-box-containing protein